MNPTLDVLSHPLATAPAQATTPAQPLARPAPAAGGWIELLRFLGDPLTYLPRIAAKHGGDLVPFQLGSLPCTLVTKPELIKQGLLNEDWPPISRGRLVNISNWFKGGLFVNAGEEHHRQRDEIWQPILADPSVPEIAAQVADDWVDGWEEGGSFDLFREARALCYAIDWKAMTGEDLRDHPALLRALETGADTLPWLILPLGQTRWKLPLPATLRAKRAQALIRARVTELIEARRRHPGRQDLLAKMVALRDGPGSRTTDDQLLSTVMMYFGADQLHAMFAWTFYLLAQNIEAEKLLHAEVDRELAGRPTPGADAAARLHYTQNVLKESMRLMPPVWGFFRELTADYRLGDTLLPQGSLMAFSPWVTQRDARYWPEPLRFDPDRWLKDAPRPPALSYFPFSAGPYWCHGANLAMVEAVQITAIIARRWRLLPTERRPPRPIATWCTEPSGGLRVRAERRR